MQIYRGVDIATAKPTPEELAAIDPALRVPGTTLIMGAVDAVLVEGDHAVLLDYKTDRRKAESDFLRAYRAQLNLYAIAIEKRFAPKKVIYKGIYSFALGKLIEA